MKITKIKNIIYAGLGILLMSGCGEGNKKEPVDFSSFFAARTLDATQNFVLDASNGGLVVGEDGTRVTVCQDGLLDSDGNTVSGDVDIELIEVLNYRDMLKLDKQSVADDNGTMRPLVSGGQVYLNAIQDGADLTPSAGCVKVHFPLESDDSNMELFIGSPAQDGSLVWNATGTPVDAVPIGAASPMVGQGSEVSVPFDPDYFYYEVELPETFGWINCDYFSSEPNRTDVLFELPEGYTNDDVSVWVVFPSINSMVRVHNHLNLQLVGGYQVAIGMEMQVVSLAQIDGQLQSMSMTLTVQDGQVVQMDGYQSTTEEAFDALIDSL